jgi:ribonuclease HI
MLDQRAERHFMRLLTQKNSNRDLILDEPDGMVHEDDISTLDSWTERTAEDLWVLGDEVEQSLPVDLEFAPWHDDELIGHHGNCIDEYHGWTDGSRRVSAAFGWSRPGYNDRGKEVELDCNKESLGEFETAFDGEMEAIADIMEYAIDNQIPADLTIHCDSQATISRVGHTRTGPGQDTAIRVVQAVQCRLGQGWRTRNEWILGHFGIEGNESADQLGGEAASGKRQGRTSIAWLKKRISRHFTMAKDSEIWKVNGFITPPAPKKSVLGRASNRLARTATIAQIRTG